MLLKQTSIESILKGDQCNFSKYIPPLSSVTYAESIGMLNLKKALESKKVSLRLDFCYKVFTNLTSPFDSNFAFTMCLPPPTIADVTIAQFYRSQSGCLTNFLQKYRVTYTYVIFLLKYWLINKYLLVFQVPAKLTANLPSTTSSQQLSASSRKNRLDAAE